MKRIPMDCVEILVLAVLAALLIIQIISELRGVPGPAITPGAKMRQEIRRLEQEANEER